MKSIADVLGEEEDAGGEEYDEYGMYVDSLADALGVDRAKAEKVASAICALARYEMERESEGPMRGHKGKPGLAIILGS